MTPKEKPIQIKCYCGHTTYCDCGALEEPKENDHSGDANEMVESQAKTLQIQSESKTISELSDEEIEKAARDYDNNVIYGPPLVHFEQGAFWYREQLKK